MKHSAYPYIITGILFLCALLAVFFLLVLPGLTIGTSPTSGGLSAQPVSASTLPVDTGETLTIIVYDPAGVSRGVNHIFHTRLNKAFSYSSPTRSNTARAGARHRRSSRREDIRHPPEERSKCPYSNTAFPPPACEVPRYTCSHESC